MNRSALSIRLLKSIREHIPNFTGKVLIADNGSEAIEIDALRAYLAQAPQLEAGLLEFGQNFGVAGGRNRVFEKVETDWILSLDNDIYLSGNPLKQIQRDIGALGCHFLSVPLLNPDMKTFYSFGGHLKPLLLDDGTPFLGAECMLPPNSPLSEAARIAPNGDGFLCTFLFGGASVLKHASFAALGGFDDNMFVGFEDIEFSLRLMRSGMKVAASTTPFFVHDHPPAGKSADRDYEKTRYSRFILKKSADYFEHKTGFRVWSSVVDECVEDFEPKQGFVVAKDQSCNSGLVAPVQGQKSRIALVVDRDNWAFANIARQVEKHLGDRFEFTIISTARLNEIQEARWKERHPDRWFDMDGPHSFPQILLLAKQYEIVHVFWRPLLTVLGPKNFYGDLIAGYAKYLSISETEFRSQYVNDACFTTSVYDHLFCSGDELELMRPVFNDYCVGYTVSSGRLEQIYRSLPDTRPPLATVPDGIDPGLFFPKNLERLNNTRGRDLVVGWVGNSQWGSERDSKGVHTILKPAIDELSTEGYPIRLIMADRAVGFTPQHEMVDFYSTIDILACTSEIEGTPNPVLEAMACGVAVVSTDVGIVRDALGPRQKEFILQQRGIAALKLALVRLLENPVILHELSAENLQSVRAWTWTEQAQKFAAFFQAVLDKRAVLRSEARSKIRTLPFTTPSQESSKDRTKTLATNYVKPIVGNRNTWNV
jgi:glycosyltransferase involved in cell wall biosynthesis/GT2 family glycosyltransferase